MTPDSDLGVVRRAGRIAAVQASLALAAVLLVVGAVVYFVDVRVQEQQIRSQLLSVAQTADDTTDPPPGMILVMRDMAAGRERLQRGRVRRLAVGPPRVIAGSAYLGAIVPESADLHSTLGIGFAARGKMRDAIAEFDEALRLDPGSALTHWHLGAALAHLRLPLVADRLGDRDADAGPARDCA